MEKERKIEAPEGCEIEKVELVDGVAVVTFREKERKLPKTWEEFCEIHPIKGCEQFIRGSSDIIKAVGCQRDSKDDRNLLPDRATAEAVLALCQLIQLRNAYNGDWVPDWKDDKELKFTIDFIEAEIYSGELIGCCSLLYFKTKELRDEFLENFGYLVEKLKPLYGIKEGGEE